MVTPCMQCYLRRLVAQGLTVGGVSTGEPQSGASNDKKSTTVKFPKKHDQQPLEFWKEKNTQ